jgi:hypothetical protein
VEENKTKKDEYLKLGFFKKMWYSMTKFEKYPEMAALGVKKAIIYFTELMLVFSIIFSAIYVYYISNIAENDGEDISLSQKIVNQLIDTNDETLNQELADTIEVLEEYPASIMVATVFLSVFISVYISTLIDVFTLSIFGLITCFFAKIKMNYKAIFNICINIINNSKNNLFGCYNVIWI